ncbi:hypothetical protein [Sandaracinus amylolyticus]|uniref:hypothetical protein n=1 Tax=Sandaracinus amylolyticus TaxID=927083 RepID=UPI001F19FE58|nr:hypothetical protein [Sandaracinus amylolyticus]UJR82442.1 Hypothetical protein I5071_45070 [Sandaracinus amylolyticus]
MTDRRERIAITSAIAAMAGALAYVGQRLWEHTRGGGADPLLVLYDPRIAFHGRALAATWWAGVAFALAYAATADARRRARIIELVARSVVPFAVVLAVLTLVWP